MVRPSRTQGRPSSRVQGIGRNETRNVASLFSAKELLLSCVNSVDVYFAEREYVCKKASFAERERSVHYPVGAFSQTSDWHVYTAFAHR